MTMVLLTGVGGPVREGPVWVNPRAVQMVVQEGSGSRVYLRDVEVAVAEAPSAVAGLLEGADDVSSGG